MKFAILMLAAAVGQQAQADTFDLECAGTLTSQSYYSGKTTEPYTSHYRLDLTSKQWCEGECVALHPLIAAQPTFLVLEQTKTDTPSETKTIQNQIDRRTGQQTVFLLSAYPGHPSESMIMKWEGTCRRLDFTGFPTFRTAF